MEIKYTGKGRCRIVLVPGGPGLATSFYRELTALLAEKNEVVTYDQRGSFTRGLEDYPKTIAEYVDELREVVDSTTEAKKPTVLFGHSFGGAVVIDALAGGMKVDGVVLSNAFPSGQMIRQGIDFRRSRLPDDFKNRYAKANGSTVDLEEINRLLGEYWFPTHFCRLDPWPDSLVDAVSKLNPHLMELFIGSNFFDAQGSLKDWNREKDLGTITRPVLVISGENDYFRPEDTRKMASQFPKGSVWISDTASHTPWLEDTEQLRAHVQEFVDNLPN